MVVEVLEVVLCPPTKEVLYQQVLVSVLQEVQVVMLEMSMYRPKQSSKQLGITLTDSCLNPLEVEAVLVEAVQVFQAQVQAKKQTQNLVLEPVSAVPATAVVAEMADLEDLLVVQVVGLVHNLLEMVQVHQVIMELKYQHLRV